MIEPGYGVLMHQDEGEARPERRDAAENRKRVLDVAQELFLHSGIEAVSMHQIALAAGVGQGTLYRRYANKGELCMDLMRENAERFRADIEAYLAGTGGAITAVARLNGVLERLVAFTEENVPFLVAVRDACSGDRRTTKFRSPWYRWMHESIEGILDDAVTAGEMAPLDTTYTADALLAALAPDLYQFQREVRGLTAEQILQGVRRIYTEGLAPSV